MNSRHNLVFLVDVDNTLLDNDSIISDLMLYLEQEVGPVRKERYFAIFESMRARLGYADYLGALQQYRLETPRDTHLLQMSSFLVDYPFADRLYNRALEVLSFLRPFGPTVILTDGDVVFQPLKVARSGISDAVDGRVLIYIHKEEMLRDVEERYPAAHYVLIDDKLRILSAIKQQWQERVTTVFPRQGHYAVDPQVLTAYPEADISVDRIADILGLDISTLSGSSS